MKQTFKSIALGLIVSFSPFITLAQPNDLMITYDANQGVSGLVGANKVYMYAGAVTSGPTGQWEWITGSVNLDNGVGLMTALGNDVWTICIDPNAYFGTGLPILAIDIIFRNETGSAFGYDFNGTYTILDLTTPSPTSSFSGVTTGNCGVGINETSNERSYIKCFPNPMQETTEIMYRLPKSNQKTTITVLESAGKIVKTFEVGNINQIHQKLIWDGENQNGDLLPNGIYVLKLTNDMEFSAYQKVVICR
jgi:hypothetical protein